MSVKLVLHRQNIGKHTYVDVDAAFRRRIRLGDELEQHSLVVVVLF
ncbi:hypothetical protein [Candidatus Moranella endobia]|nr:hypothetical protein [Candidatus Moranella endobia]